VPDAWRSRRAGCARVWNICAGLVIKGLAASPTAYRQTMKSSGSATITVSGLTGEPGWSLYCEPEGAVQVVEPGDVLTLTFTGRTPHGFEISRVADGLILCRLGDSEVDIVDKRGRKLRW
jgi:hypothetical protein